MEDAVQQLALCDAVRGGAGLVNLEEGMGGTLKPVCFFLILLFLMLHNSIEYILCTDTEYGYSPRSHGSYGVRIWRWLRYSNIASRD